MNSLKPYLGYIYLFTLLVGVPIIIYNLTIKGLMNKSMTVEIQDSEIHKLRVLNREYEAALSDKHSKNKLIDGDLLNVIKNRFSENDIEVESFRPIITYSEGSWQLISISIIIRGRYSGIIRFLDLIERDYKNCKIVSVNFVAKTDKQKDTRTIISKIIIQEIQNNN